MSDVFCNKCGFSGQADERGNHKRPSDGEVCHYVARTRPQPSAEPVAWMYEHHNHTNRSPYSANLSFTRETCGPGYGWTETPLYPASALEAARREALEQAAKKLEREWPGPAVAIVRALKENTNG